MLVLFIAYIVGKQVFDRTFPFAFQPSVSIDFQTAEGTQLFEEFFAERDCFPAYNGEAQCYREENAYVDARGLVLKAEYVGTDAEGNPVINSGRVDTREFFNPTCGKLEVVASFPSGTGVFAAIWLREPEWMQSNPSLVNPAINVAEYQGGMENFVHFNLHTKDTLAQEDYKVNSKSVQIGNFANTFHTFSVEWTKNSMSYLVDGQKYHTVENHGEWVYGPTDLIINLAMGGNWSEAIASRQGLTNTWRGIQLDHIGQVWEVVVTNIRYYPLRYTADCQ